MPRKGKMRLAKSEFLRGGYQRNLSDEKYADFTERLTAYEISQSEFIRYLQAAV